MSLSEVLSISRWILDTTYLSYELHCQYISWSRPYIHVFTLFSIDFKWNLVGPFTKTKVNELEKNCANDL